MSPANGRKWNAAIVVCSTLLVISSIARAADPAEIEGLIARGIEFRRAGNDHRALPLLKRAYDLSPTPRTAAQLGLVQMALSYRVDAEVHLNEALAAPRDPWVQKNRETLERALKAVKSSIGEIAIVGSPVGAEVLVNEAPIGRLPLKEPVRAAEGPAVIEVRAPGYSSSKVTVTVTGHGHTDAVVSLTRIVTPPLPKPVATEAEGREDVAGVVREAADTPPGAGDSEHQGSALRTAGWVTAALALGGIGFGVFESLRWHDKQSQFDTQTKVSQSDPTRLVAACGSEEPNRGSLPVCGTLYREIGDARTLAIVSYSAGAALAIGSAVLFLLSRKDPEADRVASLACVPGDSLTGVKCQFHF